MLRSKQKNGLSVLVVFIKNIKMSKLQRCFGAFLAGLFLNAILGSASVSINPDAETSPVATPPRESCSMGFSCQNASCRGGSVVGLCSKKLADNYTLRIRGKFPNLVNLFITKFNEYIVSQTILGLRILDDSRRPLLDIIFTKETIGMTLVGLTDNYEFVNAKRISKGINLNRSPDDFRISPGDDLDVYIFYKNSYITALYKHKDSKYYEVGSIFLENKIISSIIPITGPMDFDIHFEQSKTLSIPSTYVRHTMPDNPTNEIYSGPFTVRRGTYVVYPGGEPFEDGIKVVLNQGRIEAGITHKFIRIRDSSVQMILRIDHLGNYRYRFNIDNIFNKENKSVIFDGNSLKSHLTNGDIVHLGYLFTDGHMFICISDTCFAKTVVKGSEIGKIESNIWFTSSMMFSIPEQTIMGTATGSYKCRIGETSCFGSEFRLKNPLSPGQRLEVTSLFDSGGYFKRFAPVSQKGLVGAIAMGDNENMRAAVFLALDSVSLTLFSESGIVTDLCSVYLSGNSVINIDKELSIIIGLSNSNKLGVSGYVGNKVKMYCEVDLGSIYITRIRPVKNNFHSGSSKFTITNDYPAQGYDSISGGSSASRTQQQAANCYLATNGVCHASKVVHMDGMGFVSGVYTVVRSTSVSFPFTIYIRSSENNSDQLALTLVSTGKFSMRNVNTQDIIYSKVPPSCMERILIEGLSLLISSDESRVFASVCGFILGNVPSKDLNKKLAFTFSSTMKGTSIQVSTFPVYGGGDNLLDFAREKYDQHSSNIIKDDDLLFAAPCDARGSASTRLEKCSSLINMSSNRLTNGYSIFITGTVEKPSSHVEQAFNIGIPIDDAIQVFNFKAGNGRTLYQLFITADQLGLSIHHHNGVNTSGPHVGASIPSNVNLEEGSKYRIGVAFKDSQVYMLIETPYGSGKYYILKRTLVSKISGWGETIYNFKFKEYEPIRSIVPELLVRSSYDYSLSNNESTWVPVSKDFYAPRSGDNSCSLNIYGVCTTSKVFMPGNKPVNNNAKFIMRFYTFRRNIFTIYFKREDGLIVASAEFSTTSTMWNGQISIKFKTRVEESILKYNIDLGLTEFIVIYTGNSLGYFIGGQWRILLALEDGDSFNQIVAPDLDGIVVEYIRTSNSNPSPWQYLNYGSTRAKASMTLGYDQCNARNPDKGWFSKPGTYYPGSYIENLCSTSLHQNKFAVVFKSRYPNYVKEEIAKTFSNFPGFLQSIVLLYNGSVVYTLVVARKYISFFSSLYSGEASKFSSCSSQVPDESEFQPGSPFHITFYVDSSDLHVYFHSFKEGRSALLCKIPYNSHFNSAKVFGQVNISSNTVAGIDYNIVRTLYTPQLNSSNLYPMGTVVTKNAILSSGMPFSPNESLSIQMTCGKELIFSGKTGKPQLRLKVQGSSFTLENITGKLTSSGVLYGNCVCSSADRKIVVNIAYVNSQFRLIACMASAASIFTTGASIYQISSESELKVIYRTDLRLAAANSLTSSQISKVEEQPDTSKDEEAPTIGDKYIPQSFKVQATLHVVPSYVKS